MADVSSATKFFPTSKEGFTTTTSSGINSGASSVPLTSVTGLTNGATMVFVIDPTDATKKQAFTGVVDTSGLQITGVVWTEGTNTSHASGATVVDYETATHWALYNKGLLVEHGQDGKHTDITATSAAITGGGSWAGSPTITTPTIASFANSNHDHSNSAGGGTLPYASVATGLITSATTGSDTGASGTYKVSNLSLTATLLARPVKITASVHFGQRTSSNTVATRVIIKEGATILKTAVGFVNGALAATNECAPLAIHILTPTAGSHTYDVYIQMADGSDMSITDGFSYLEYV